MKKALENFIFLMVILVIGQTFLEEAGVIFSFDLKWRNLLIVTGVCFDLIFSIEFGSRLILAARQKKIRRYLFQEMGWVDFLSSLPLLILSSGPLFMAYASPEASMTSAGFARSMSMLKMAKVVRIARILRVMRFLKLLKNIRFINSQISQQHINYLASLMISTMIFGVMLLGLTGVWNQSDLQAAKKQSYQHFLSRSLEVSIKNSTDFVSLLPGYLEQDPNIFLAEHGDQTLYSKKFVLSVSEGSYMDHFSFNRIHIYYLDHDSMLLQARFTLSIMILVILQVLALIFLYAAKFSLEVSDTIKVVEKGMTDPDYFLRLKEDEGRNDEVEELAQAYNNVWLPVKLRYQSEIYAEDQEKQVENLMKQMENIDLESFLKDE